MQGFSSNRAHVPFGWDLVGGSFPWLDKIDKFGSNPDIDPADGYKDICHSAPYTGFPSLAEQMEVVSSSPNDTAGGSGARTIKIYGLLDANFNKMPAVTLTMNGTTPVGLGAQTYIRGNRGRITSAGVTGSNEGVITLRHVTTTTNVFFNMPIGYNSTMLAAYTIPSGTSGMLTSVRASLSGKTGANSSVRLLVRPYGMPFRVEFEQSIFGAGSSRFKEYFEDVPMGLLLPKTDILVRADTDTNNTAIAAGFNGVTMPYFPEHENYAR